MMLFNICWFRANNLYIIIDRCKCSHALIVNSLLMFPSNIKLSIDHVLALYGPSLTVNQSMFTEVEVANQWHFRAHNNPCPICFLFVIKLVSS